MWLCLFKQTFVTLHIYSVILCTTFYCLCDGHNFHNHKCKLFQMTQTCNEHNKNFNKDHQIFNTLKSISCVPWRQILSNVSLMPVNTHNLLHRRLHGKWMTGDQTTWMTLLFLRQEVLTTVFRGVIIVGSFSILLGEQLLESSAFPLVRQKFVKYFTKGRERSMNICNAC